MEFTINQLELEKALKDIKRAKKNGFNHCLCVFKLTRAGQYIEENIAGYSDLLEKASNTDGNLNFGRFQNVTQYNKFVKGKLIPAKNSPYRKIKI